jgi:hypothetical protein
MKARCKKRYPTYAAALRALFEKLERPELGSAPSGKSSSRSLGAGSSAMPCVTGSRTRPHHLGGFVPRPGEGRGV